MADKLTDETFFARRSDEVAKDLLGRTLVRQNDEGILRLVLSEIEAFDGAVKSTSKGLNYAPGLCSISHKYQYMVDISTGNAGEPSGITLRGAISEDGHKRINGPGNLTKIL